MNSKRFYFVMIGVTTLLGISIIGAVYFGNVLLQKQAHKLVALKLDSRVADQQQTLLVQAKKDIEKYTPLQNEAQAIVPQDKDQAEAIREIVNIANRSGVKLGTITFPTSTLGQTVPKAATGSAGPITPPVTQVQPVIGIKGVFAMPITIQSDTNVKISYGNFISFLSRLEANRRTAQVASVTITPDRQDSAAFSFILVVNVYIKP